MKDLLKTMVDGQKEFREILGGGKDPFDSMNEQEKGERLYHTLVCLVEEIMETMATLNYKGHTKEAKEGRRFTFKNKEQTYEELADVMCYFLDAIALAGMSAEKLTAVNVAKTEINKQRQLRNYSQAEKVGNEAGADSKQLWEKIKDQPETLKVKVLETTREPGFEGTIVIHYSVNEELKNLMIYERDFVAEGSPRTSILRRIGVELGQPFEIVEFNINGVN
jgi:hypothetical protein